MSTNPITTKDQFPYEGHNVQHLIGMMFQTQKNGWDGPGLGVKQATENKRQFDDEVAFSLFILFQMIFM